MRQIRVARLKYGVSCVFIDHLHYLARVHEQKQRMENFSIFLGDRVRELRRIATETGVTLFLVAHMAKTEDGARPTLADIRDSSFVAQEADAVFVLWRERLKEPMLVDSLGGNGKIEETFSPWTCLAVEKARRTGKRGQIYLLHENGLYHEATFAQIQAMKATIQIISPKYGRHP